VRAADQVARCVLEIEALRHARQFSGAAAACASPN
jgi:hypothetical protein